MRKNTVKEELDYMNEKFNKDGKESFFKNNKIKNKKIINERKYSNIKKILNQEEKNIRTNKKDKYFFPFDVNESQYEVVTNVFKNKYSLIEGPPGTGKTNTILNILANAVMQNKTVAVISTNNGAVDNVFEKLKENNFENICVSVGSKKKTEDFFNSFEVDNRNSELSEKEIYTKFDEVDKVFKKNQKNYRKKNLKAKLNSELNELKKEHKYFQKYNIKKFSKKLTFLSSRNILKITNFIEKNKVINKLLDSRLTNREKNNYINLMYDKYYQKKIKELQKKINKLTFDKIDQKLEKEVKKSKYIFTEKTLTKKRKKYEKIPHQEKEYNEFLLEYPVLLTTASSLLKNISLKYTYDYLIIDEASQMNIYDGLTSLTAAKNIIVVGDKKQLAPVVPAKIETKLKQSFLTYYHENIENVYSVTLKEHYRCEYNIINFCNKFFYENKLYIHTQNKGKSMNFISCKNENEVNDYLEKIKENHEIGVIGPYKKSQGSTIHTYQGREKNIIFFGIDKNNITKFLSNENLINVGISRAKKEFNLVCKDFSKEKNIISELIKYIKYHTFDEKEYDNKTVFSVLYGEKNKISKISPAEEIIEVMIKKIIKEKNLKQYVFVKHVSLNKIFYADQILNEEEKKFKNDARAHVDFLIYYKSNNKPALSIEVDGYTFHKTEDANRRDSIKDSIHSKYNLKLLRLSTQNESNEYNRIEKALINI